MRLPSPLYWLLMAAFGCGLRRKAKRLPMSWEPATATYVNHALTTCRSH